MAYGYVNEIKEVYESRTASVLGVAKWLLLAEKLCTVQIAGIPLGTMPAERLYHQERVGHCTLCSCIKNELYNILFIKVISFYFWWFCFSNIVVQFLS